MKFRSCGANTCTGETQEGSSALSVCSENAGQEEGSAGWCGTPESCGCSSSPLHQSVVMSGLSWGSGEGRKWR